LALNTTLLAFAAERHAAAPLLLSAGACYQSMYPVRGALQIWIERRLLSTGQTDRRTPDRYIDPAPHAMRAVSIAGYIQLAALHEYVCQPKQHSMDPQYEAVFHHRCTTAGLSVSLSVNTFKQKLKRGQQRTTLGADVAFL